jgi:ketosteroid isomerase-like protein
VPSPRPLPEPSRPREQQDRGEISAVLTAYQQAYDNRSIDQLRGIYPGISAQDSTNLRQSFRLASAIHTELREQSLNVNGDSAESVCAQSMQVVSSGQKQTLNSSATFWLSRQSGRWLIQRIQYAKR